MEKENDNASELKKEETTIKDEDISKNEQKEDHSLEDKLNDIEEKLIRSMLSWKIKEEDMRKKKTRPTNLEEWR